MDKKIITSAFTFLSSSVAIQIVNFTAQVILMRYLSIHDFGMYSLSFEGLAMCNMVITSAFRNFYMREINKGNNADNLLSYQLIYGSFWCVVSTGVVGVIFSLGFTIIITMAMSMVISALILPIWVELIVYGRKKLVILRDITYALSTLIFILISCVIGNTNITHLIILIFTMNALLAILFFVNKQNFKLYFKLGNIEKVSTSLTPFFMMFIVNTAYNKIGVTFINHFAGVVYVAKYLATFKFITPLFFVQTALISSVLPKFKSESDFRFDFGYFTFFALPGLLISIALPLLLPIIINILGLKNYESIPYYLEFGSAVIFVSFIYGSLSNYISIKGGQLLIIKTNLIGMLVYLFFIFTIYFLFPKEKYIQLCLLFFVITESFICMKYYYQIKKDNYIHFVFILSPVFVILFEMYMFYQLI